MSIAYEYGDFFADPMDDVGPQDDGTRIVTYATAQLTYTVHGVSRTPLPHPPMERSARGWMREERKETV